MAHVNPKNKRFTKIWKNSKAGKLWSWNIPGIFIIYRLVLHIYTHPYTHVFNIYLHSVRHWRRRQDSNLIFQLHNFPAFEFFQIFVKRLCKHTLRMSTQNSWFKFVYIRESVPRMLLLIITSCKKPLLADFTYKNTQNRDTHWFWLNFRAKIPSFSRNKFVYMCRRLEISEVGH
jgi:hypothetical protein